MLAYLQYAMHVIMSFLFITMMFIMIPRAVVSAQRIGQVIDTEPTIEDPEKAETLADPQGLVEFRNVSFVVPGCRGEDPGEYQLHCGAGEDYCYHRRDRAAASSTLVSLIPRFYDVTEGQVLMDGVDIRELTQHQLRDQIGYVPQKGPAVFRDHSFKSTVR